MKIQKEVIIGLILVLIVAGFIGYSILGSRENKAGGSAQTNTKQTGQTGVNSSPSNTPNSKTLTMAEVAKHGTPSDCWIVISNKVYNVTNFEDSHPGGKQTIISSCGADATEKFMTKGGKGSHSPKAQQALQSFYIGNVNGVPVSPAVTGKIPFAGEAEGEANEER